MKNFPESSAVILGDMEKSEIYPDTFIVDRQGGPKLAIYLIVVARYACMMIFRRSDDYTYSIIIYYLSSSSILDFHCENRSYPKNVAN